MTVEAELAAAADGTIRVPRNVMALLRQSYDTREKALDWILAIGVAATMAYVFWPQMVGWYRDGSGPNAGRDPSPQPSQDVAGAFPVQRANASVYTYNMPASRTIRYRPGPNATKVPNDPSRQPTFPE